MKVTDSYLCGLLVAAVRYFLNYISFNFEAATQSKQVENPDNN